MRRVPWILGPVACAAVVCAVGLAAQSPQRPIFRADVNFITVDAYPLVDGRVVEMTYISPILTEHVPWHP